MDTCLSAASPVCRTHVDCAPVPTAPSGVRALLARKFPVVSRWFLDYDSQNVWVLFCSLVLFRLLCPIPIIKNPEGLWHTKAACGIRHNLSISRSVQPSSYLGSMLVYFLKSSRASWDTEPDFHPCKQFFVWGGGGLFLLFLFFFKETKAVWAQSKGYFALL